MATTKKLMGTTATAAGGGGGELLAIEDVFSTYLYDGNGSTQTITNGIDLAGEGGLVWLKRRDNIGNNGLFSSNFGDPPSHYLISNSTGGQSGSSNIVDLLSTGFSVNGAIGDFGVNNATYASWTFRKAPRFFDVVTYTGDGVAGRNVAHNLGSVPGCIIAKNVSRAEGWRVYHRSQGATKYAMLQSTNAFAAASTVWNNTEPTDSVFTTGSDSGTNGTGDTIVAYLFAHDPLGPSGDGSDGLIACGSYTVSGGSASIDLGWEPQFVITKVANASGAWIMFDNMRGMAVNGVDAYLRPDSNNAENSGSDFIDLTPTGFNIKNLGGSQTFIYIAIRRGPMRAPTSGTEVFAIGRHFDSNATANGVSYYSGFPVDLILYGTLPSSPIPYWRSRIAGNRLRSDDTSAEATQGGYYWQSNVGVAPGTGSPSLRISYMFRRAPGFFDVVAYTGDGVAGRTVSHNLGVAPEFIITKVRTSSANWNTYHVGLSAWTALNLTNASFIPSAVFGNFTASSFDVNAGNTQYNASGQNYIAYLFATLPGVSKVGSYTGNGTSQTIDCGFTSGARFILIKRTDSTGDWYLWDTARGIVTGNDPFLELNTTDAEVTSDDSIDPDSSGFIVNQTATTNVNVNAASYIYLAIS